MLLRVLGRIGSGSTVAGVWVGCAAIAAAEDSACFVWVFAGLVALTFGVTFAPKVPRVRNLLPTVRTINELEVRWAEGQRLLVAGVTSEAELKDWKGRVDAWQDGTQRWLSQRVSQVDGIRFYQPHYSDWSHALGESFDPQHQNVKNRIVHQLADLLRIRGEQERKLH